MPNFVPFHSFVEAVMEKKHNLSSDTLKWVLTADAPDDPDETTDDELADITQIANGNGYTTGGTAATISSSSQSGGLYRLILGDTVFTCVTAPMAPFRFAVLYNDTAANDELIGYVDYGSLITLNVGESFTVDCNASLGIFTCEIAPAA